MDGYWRMQGEPKSEADIQLALELSNMNPKKAVGVMRTGLWLVATGSQLVGRSTRGSW